MDEVERNEKTGKSSKSGGRKRGAYFKKSGYSLCDELKEPLTIILNNLVRNSLEHGARGVRIEQSGKRIDITNIE